MLSVPIVGGRCGEAVGDLASLSATGNIGRLAAAAAAADAAIVASDASISSTLLCVVIVNAIVVT